MAITKDEVIYVSKLSKIKIKNEDMEKFTNQLDQILEYISKLNEIDTEKIAPTSHVVDLKNVMRKDKLTGESLSNEEATAMGPDTENKFFKVPKVIE